MPIQANAVRRSDMTLINTPHPENLDPTEFLANPNFSAVENIPKYFWKIVGSAVVEMNQSEKDAVTAAELPAAKRERARGITEATPLAMEASGFDYNSKTFPMTVASLARFHLLYDGRAALTYPIIIAGKDIDDFESIADAAEMASFGAALIGAVDDAMVTERGILQEIKNATTIAEVEAVVDPRPMP